MEEFTLEDSNSPENKNEKFQQFLKIPKEMVGVFHVLQKSNLFTIELYETFIGKSLFLL